MATITKPHSETASPTILKTMHAAAIERFGGSEVLKTHKLPTPVVDKGEVLIALHTSGVGIWDAEMRTGDIPTRHPHFPMVLGSDGAGHIAAVGSHVRSFHLGDASRRNWFPVSQEDLIQASSKLGASPNEVKRLLNRSGFAPTSE